MTNAMGRSRRSLARSLWIALCTCALSACDAQDLNSGLLLDHPDGAESGGNQSMDAADDVPVVVGPVGSGGVFGGTGGSIPPSSGGENGASCSTVVPCGGDVVGVWTVASSCLAISGEADLSMLGLGCASAPIAGALRVAGTWAAKSDGTYWDNTLQTGDVVLSLPASCLDVSGTLTTCERLAPTFQSLGYATASCAPAASGGCTCSATVNQTGGLGQVSVDISTEGAYSTSANVVTVNSGEKYSYCLSGGQLTWTPQTTGIITTGAVVFQDVSLVGSGGSSGNGGAVGNGGSTGVGGSTVVGTLPCDVYAGEGGPCVAAHSTVRALSAAYAGPLYQVRRSDGTLQDIPVTSPGGFADASVQDSFCFGYSCTIAVIYDQSGTGNHLTKAPKGGAKSTPGNEADAMALPITLSGHEVYGVHLVPGVGYRNSSAVGTATGDNPETIYMVADGKYYNAGCCFDYGNAETNNNDDGEGAAEAVYFGSCNIWGQGAGEGPWVMGDLENGLWPGDVTPYAANPSLTYKYVTAMVKGDAAGRNHWMIKVGNAQVGALAAVFDGPRPNARYNPMRKEGAIILGIAGDNSNGAQGNFFEGIMTAQFSTDAADNAAQASIVSAYGQ